MCVVVVCVFVCFHLLDVVRCHTQVGIFISITASNISSIKVAVVFHSSKMVVDEHHKTPNRM